MADRRADELAHVAGSLYPHVVGLQTDKKGRHGRNTLGAMRGTPYFALFRDLGLWGERKLGEAVARLLSRVALFGVARRSAMAMVA